MRVLVACEESQRVCKAFRERGAVAFSCDIQDCSGGHNEWHIKGDISNILNPTNGIISFTTVSNDFYSFLGRWDLIIAHPPCTYFSNATMVNLGRKDNPKVFNEEWKECFFKKREKAFEFVKMIWNADCDKIAIENTVGFLCTNWTRPTQYIEPFMFGDPYRKKTCLWLKNLPCLYPTNVVNPLGKWVKHNLKSKNDLIGYSVKGVYSAKERSKTFYGIANAMAEQWLNK